MKGSYAQQASKIMSKYKLRLGENFDKDDPLAKKALDMEMAQLQEKQEAEKASMQPTQPQLGIQPQLKQGGGLSRSKDYGSKKKPYPSVKKSDFAGGERSYPIPTKADAVDALRLAGLHGRSDVRTKVYKKYPGLKKKQFGGGLGVEPLNFRNTSTFNPNDPYGIYNIENAPINLQGDPGYANIGGNYTSPRMGATRAGVENIVDDVTQPEKKYYNPSLGGTSAIPLATSVAGNILLGARAGKGIEDVKYDRIKPTEINLGREREAAKRDAELNRNLAVRNARGLGLSAGAAANVGIAARGDISRTLGERVGKSYTQEEITNAQNKRIIDQINASIGMREVDTNKENAAFIQAQKDQTIQNILQGTGQYFSDVQKAKTYNQLHQQIADDYQLYEDPNQKTLNRILFGTQSVKGYNPKTS